QDPAHHTDTYNFGPIFNFFLKHSKKDLSIRFITLSCNPASYDEVSKEFLEILNKQCRIFEDSFSIKRITGPGTPAMNFAGIALDFAYPVESYYAMAPKKDGEQTTFKRISLFSDLKIQKEKELFYLLIESYQYKLAVDYLKGCHLKRYECLSESLRLIEY
ncbi:unnamed protein product, partial [marine sediment metagenome]